MNDTPFQVKDETAPGVVPETSYVKRFSECTIVNNQLSQDLRTYAEEAKEISDEAEKQAFYEEVTTEYLDTLTALTDELLHNITVGNKAYRKRTVRKQIHSVFSSLNTFASVCTDISQDQIERVLSASRVQYKRLKKFSKAAARRYNRNRAYFYSVNQMLQERISRKKEPVLPFLRDQKLYVRKQKRERDVLALEITGLVFFVLSTVLCILGLVSLLNLGFPILAFMSFSFVGILFSFLGIIFNSQAKRHGSEKLYVKMGIWFSIVTLLLNVKLLFAAPLVQACYAFVGLSQAAKAALSTTTDTVNSVANVLKGGIRDADGVIQNVAEIVKKILSLFQ